MANPLWNLSGALTEHSQVLQNVGGTLVNCTKALENIGGTLTTVWEQANSSNIWESWGYNASTLAKSTVDHSRGSGTISSVSIDGNTATFKVLLTGGMKSSFSYYPYGPYESSATVYTYACSDFKITTPASNKYIGDACFDVQLSPVSTYYYSKNTEYAIKKNDTSDSNIVTEGYTNSSNSVIFTTAESDYGSTRGQNFYITTAQSKLPVTLTVTYLYRRSPISSAASLVTSAMTVPSYSSTTTRPNTGGGPYVKNVTVYRYVIDTSFTLSAKSTISLSRTWSSANFPESGTITLKDSGGNTLASFDKAYRRITGTSTLSYTASPGKYYISYDWYSLSKTLDVIPVATEVV